MNSQYESTYPPRVYIKAAELAGTSIAEARYICSLLADAQDIISRQRPRYIPVDLETLIKDICVCRKITPVQLKSGTKTRELSDTRIVYYIIARELFPNITIKEIADSIYRDASTIRGYLKESKQCTDRYRLYLQIKDKLIL
jgi:chromosomal replication initiation ATPase DnaA